MPFWVLAATAGAIAAGVLLSGRPLAIDQRWPRQNTAPHPAPIRSAAMDIAAGTLGGSAALAALFWSIGAYSYHGHVFTSNLSTWACAVWAGGLGIALLWLGIHGRQSACGDAQTTRRTPVGRVELAAFFVILLVGAGLRLWHLGGLPEGIWSDEVDSAQDAIRLLHLPFQPFAPGNVGHNPSLYFYAIAGVFKVAGASITAARVTSALFGIFGIVVVYLLGRLGGGPALGLIAAALIAVTPWSITFSRVAMPDIPVPAITGLGYFFLILAL
ncbi:MAG: ArnT family glycosyltransferase, partial [Chloroflexota bacterium]